MINEFRPMNHLTSLQNFICTIGNLPTSYALSLSYEEQIWWLCDFLEKKVFPAIEENTNITEETQASFIELQQYVTDYFNNLDVQEEINNKLDEMVEDGTLSNILMNYANVERIYNTTVEMIADNSNLHNNQKIKTLGYYTVNDGGGAEFLITNIEDTNEFQIPIGSLFATLIIKGYINPLQMGVQDNVETNLLTKASQISQIHKVPINLKPEITYLINESFPLFTDCVINGQGAIIECPYDLPVLFAQNPVSNLNINNLIIKCSNNLEHNNSNGIEGPCYYSQFDNITIYNGYNSIKITENTSGTLVENHYNNITCRNPRYCGLYLGEINNNKITDGFINNVVINGGSGCNYGIYIGSYAGYNINNIHTYGNITTPLAFFNGFYSNISNVYIEKAINNAISCTRCQTSLNFNNMIIKQTNNNEPCLYFGRSSYHPTNDSNIYVSNTTIIRNSDIITNVISSPQLKVVLSNVHLNAENQKLEDYCEGCIFSLIGKNLLNNIININSKNEEIGKTRIHHRIPIRNTSQLVIDIPDYNRWNLNLLHLTCYGAVYQTQAGKYYSADIYFFINDGDTPTIKIFNEQNSMFTNINVSLDIDNKQIIVNYEFNADNIYAIADYTVDI